MEKIWRFNGDDKAPHEHEIIKGRKVLKNEGNKTWLEYEIANPDGKGSHKEKWLMTMNPPKGYHVEYLDGPMKGSSFDNNYQALGPNKTRVDAEGNFSIAGMDEAGVRKTILGFWDMVFREDTRNLKRYK